jgi:hypothetical protein
MHARTTATKSRSRIKRKAAAFVADAQQNKRAGGEFKGGAICRVFACVRISFALESFLRNLSCFNGQRTSMWTPDYEQTATTIQHNAQMNTKSQL